MGEPAACECHDDSTLCERCRLTAIEVALAVEKICESTRASAVNEIEYTDPFTGRVSTLRREATGSWRVTDVRPLGSQERARLRPTASSA